MHNVFEWRWVGKWSTALFLVETAGLIALNKYLQHLHFKLFGSCSDSKAAQMLSSLLEMSAMEKIIWKFQLLDINLSFFLITGFYS